MPMRRTILISSVAVVMALAPVASSQRASRAELRFQEAHRKETIDGDLKSAIDLYRRAIAEAGSNRLVAAQALVRMGECYEKLGDAEARKAYERVVREFGDQKDLVETARVHLAALWRAGAPGQSPGITLRKVWTIERGWLEGSPSPDGRYHSFHEPETGDLALRDLTTGQNRRLTNKGTWVESGEYAEASVISGDGKQIAYAWYNKEKFYELRICGIDGSNPRTVYRDKEFGHWLEPYQWTPDGKQILAILERRKGEEELALIPAAGGPARLLNPSRWWWYANVSPDGRFLVYDAFGEGADESDIYLLPLEGGQAVPLVRSPAQDANPVWMPAGDKVLFVSDRTGSNGFWAIDVVEGKPRGIPRLLKDGAGGVWSEIRPNGFTRRGDFYFSTSTDIGEVYVTELDPIGGKVLRPPAPVPQRPPRPTLAPSWSPDGRRLAYYSLSLRDGQRAPTLVILSVETGEARDVPVKLDLVRRPVHVQWFPDGKTVLVGAYDSARRDQVAFYRVDVETGEHRLVRSSPGPGIGHAELSPDGRTLFFFTPGEAKFRGGLISRDLETGEEREIARVPHLAVSGWARLAISPDGKHLAFRSPVDEHEWTALRLVPASGGELRELGRFWQSETEDFPELAWTPDSRNVLIVRRTGKDGMPELWRIPIAGGEPQRTGLSAESMGIVAPHPDGRRIAFETGYGGVEANELWVLENIPAAVKSKEVSAAK